MKKIRGLCLPVMLGAVLMSQHVHAADNLTFKGKLIIPACTVQNAEVNWGDIEIQNLVQSGGNQKDFTVDMNCPYSLGTMKVTITSNGQTGNSILVPNTSTASGDGLLIYLYNSNNSGIGNAVTLGVSLRPEKSQEQHQPERLLFTQNLDIKEICRVCRREHFLQRQRWLHHIRNSIN